MEKRKQIYEGKAKKLYQTDNPDLVIQEFKDDATAFDATKKGTIKQKGEVNNAVSKIIFELLESKGVETHFVEQQDERNMVVKRVEIIPIEVTIRNIVAGGMSKLLGIAEGLELEEPVLEYHYKEDALHDPLINNYHIRALKLATDEELEFIKMRSFEINNILKAFFSHKNLELVDFKLEFGRHKGKILLADEVSPDTCRLWDKKTKKKLDKDRFRQDLGGVEEAYQEVLRRIAG
jgi:phosphoribosylaminoimidazole-succinocarboxamide synthase